MSPTPSTSPRVPQAERFYTFDRRLIRHAQAAGLSVIEPEASDEAKAP